MTSSRLYRTECSSFRTVLGLLVAASMTLNGATTAFARPHGDAAGTADAAGSIADRTRNAAVRYQLGANAFRSARYREAVTHFLAADALVPSAALSYNTALAYDKLMETGPALSFYRDYLRRDPDGESADEVAARIRQLELRLMHRGVQQLTILSEPPGALVRLEDEPVGKTPWTGELEPGEHRLTVALEGYRQSTRTVLLPAANAVDVRVHLEPETPQTTDVGKEAVIAPPPDIPPAPPPEPIVQPSLVSEPVVPLEPPPRERSGASNFVPWLTVGVGAAALAASGTFELLRRQSETEARSALTSRQRERREDQASTYRTTSLVLLGTGGGLVFTGSMLLLFGSRKNREPSADVEPSKSREAAFNASVGCTTDGCFGSYARSF